MQKTWSYQQNWCFYFYYYSGQHTNWWPTSPEHVTHPFCNRPSRQVRPTSPTLPLWPPSSTATSVPTFQTKCYPNVHEITPISQPKGILLLTNHNWLLHPTQHFYEHSYLAPTLSTTTVQSLGISLAKAFAYHIRYASQKFTPSPFGNPPPTYVGD